MCYPGVPVKISRATYMDETDSGYAVSQMSNELLIPIQFEDALNTALVMKSHPVTERITSLVISDKTACTR